MSFSLQMIRISLRALRWIRGKKSPTLQEARRRFRRIGHFTKVSKSTKITQLGANGVLCEYYSPPNEDPQALIVFLHGGGYCIGSLDTYRAWLSRLAECSNIPILAVAYQQAPEHPFPTAPSNALSAYEWALNQYNNKKIFLLGDSAGGGLALATMLKMREENIPLPQAAILIAPWVDLTLEKDSLTRLAHKDLIMRKKDLEMLANLYAGKEAKTNPFISPLFASLEGLPPVYIQQGTEDLFFDEVNALHKKLLEAGVKSHLEIWKGMPHVWHLMYDQLKEAKQATQSIVAFIRKQITTENVILGNQKNTSQKSVSDNKPQ
ncbi:MAG: hypothetical protein OHK0045_11590 [Raineya sp.]